MKHLISLPLSLLLPACFICSCSNENVSFVSARYQEMPLRTAVQRIPSGQMPAVINVRDLPAATSRYEASGYVVLGALRLSEAEGGSLPYREVAAFAKQRGAAVVLTNDQSEGYDAEARQRVRRGEERAPETAPLQRWGELLMLSPDEQYFIFLSPRA